MRMVICSVSVMKVNLHDDENNSLASKNEAGSGVGQKSALEIAF